MSARVQIIDRSLEILREVEQRMRALYPSWPRTYITGTAFILKLIPDLQKVSVQIVWRGEIVPMAVAV